MYSRPSFQMSKQQCFELLGIHFFGQLITTANGKIVQTFVPFIVDKENNCLIGHIAKRNKQVEALEASDDLIVTYLGDDAYISPSWYQSAEQVPTWNYQAVEIKGKVTLFDDQGTFEVVDKLSQIHEAQFEDPWLVGKVSEKNLRAKLKAIVGFRIDISEMKGHSKMSQNKTTEDLQGVIDGLLTQSDTASHRVAEIMRKGK